MIQQSLFPDEVPNRQITSPNRHSDYTVYLRRFLRAEGFYNFAMMAMRIKETPDDVIYSYHKMEKRELFAMCEGVFGDACAYQETIATFLYRTKNEIAFTLVPVNNEKDDNSKGRRKRR